jgi:hypothetical protein
VGVSVDYFYDTNMQAKIPKPAATSLAQSTNVKAAETLFD